MIHTVIGCHTLKSRSQCGVTGPSSLNHILQTSIHSIFLNFFICPLLWIFLNRQISLLLINCYHVLKGECKCSYKLLLISHSKPHLGEGGMEESKGWHVLGSVSVMILI